ncbi:MAG: citrate synthase [Chloroflexota bacterium]|nr:citrate synthase [Chloroflexota bacterium]
MSKPEASPPAAKGLAGIVVGDTSVSFVDGTQGVLEYRGYDIRVLAENSAFEEVAYLLWNGHLPTAQELQAMKAQARACRFLPPEVLTLLRNMPKNADPMAVMRSAVSVLAHYDPESEENSLAAHQHKACRLLGQISGVVAAYERIRCGEEPIKPRMDLDHAANFLWMLTGEDPEPLAARALDQYLLLLAEHELNASTFTARVIASTGSELHSAITGALGALKGPAHGAAVQEAMVQFLDIGTPDNVQAWFEKGRAEGRRVMGIGHRVYKVRDPRAGPLMKNVEMMVAATGDRQWFDIASKLEAVATQDPYFKDRNLSANVDFYSAPLLYSIGIPVDAFTCMFAMSRIVGWTAHVYEQQADNRLIRPLGNYTGQHPLPWVAMEQR